MSKTNGFLYVVILIGMAKFFIIDTPSTFEAVVTLSLLMFINNLMFSGSDSK